MNLNVPLGKVTWKNTFFKTLAYSYNLFIVDCILRMAFDLSPTHQHRNIFVLPNILADFELASKLSAVRYLNISVLLNKVAMYVCFCHTFVRPQWYH